MSLVRVTRMANSVSEAISALNEQVLHTVSRRRIEQQDLIRVEVALKSFDLLAWLSSQRESTKFYWRDRETGTEYAGLGAIETITLDSTGSLRQLDDAIVRRSEPNLRWYGGLPFDLSRPPDKDRNDFSYGRFVLPGIEVEMAGDSATLACNIALHDSRLYSRLACLGDIDPRIWNENDSFAIRDRREFPSRETWDRTIESILGDITAGTIRKLVPARQVILDLAEPLNPYRALARLKAQGGAVSLFCFQADDSSAFIGASPERLYKRRGRTIETEAIAGTITRGSNPEEDSRLATQLLASDKDRREHELVVDFLRESLEPLTNSLSVDKTSVLTLPHLQHLRTLIRGKLRESVSDSDLLTALHPTPAVAGLPRETALELIREIEPFDRGWYAGPVGWIGADEAEFAVAIRSVLVTGNQLILTAGAGIVEGSDARAEWEETEQKIRSTLDTILP